MCNTHFWFVISKQAFCYRYYLLLANCTVMVLIPLLSLSFLNWEIYKAVKNREKFRATLSQSMRKSKRAQSSSPSSQEHSPHSNMVNANTTSSDEEDSKCRKRNKEREVTISQILLAIVIMFFVCQSFKVRVRISWNFIAQFDSFADYFSLTLGKQSS